MNSRNELIYTYTKTRLKTKTNLSRTITFKGRWDISEKTSLSYVLNDALGSGFDFQVGAGKPAKRGLQYEIGIGVKPQQKKITLCGAWKVNEKLGLEFQMPYAEGKIRSIVFGATCTLKNDYTIEARLRNNFDEDLGIELTLTKTILKGRGQVFLEALKNGSHASLLAGFGLRW